MLIAKINGQTVVDVADYQSMFPQTSFPTSGPDAEFLAANSCMTVTMWKPYDQATEKLASVPAYIEDNQVFTVQVEPLTPEEIEARDAFKKAQVKAQAIQLLTDTDWTQMPDVALVNKDAFTAYRGELRAIALNPPVTVETWPVKPEEVWS